MSKREYKSSVFSMLLEEPEIDAFLNLYEHQSTYNPNMPLRFMLYFSDMMWDFVDEKDYNMYGSRRIPVPTPKFVVFYNGTEKRPAREVIRLSDSYEHKCEDYDLDLVCTVYNINQGCNDEMQKNSKVLLGYTTFIEKVRTYERKKWTALKKPLIRRSTNALRRTYWQNSLQNGERRCWKWQFMILRLKGSSS
jgi:hypothetical protein